MSAKKLTDYFDMLEADLIEEIFAVLGDHSEDKDFKLNDVQPPTTIIRAAAFAAAQVFVAFERGYQNSGDEDE